MADIGNLPTPGQRPWDLNPAITAMNNELNERLGATQLKNSFISANPNLTVAYNPDGSVASTTEDGVLSSYTYNSDGTVATQTRAGVTKTFTYGPFGVTGAS